jgi:hypothetical protein
MSDFENEAKRIVRAANRIAWRKFNAFPRQTPDEKVSGPAKMREYIKTLVASGERNPEKIAASSIALIREYEQIARSQGSVTSPDHRSETIAVRRPTLHRTLMMSESEEGALPVVRQGTVGCRLGLALKPSKTLRTRSREITLVGYSLRFRLRI